MHDGFCGRIGVVKAVHDEAVERVRAEVLSHTGILDLSGLDLEDLPPELSGLTGLTTLDLSGNGLLRLPEWLGNLTALIRLDLAGNRLERLPVSFGNLTALAGLDLSDNRLERLPVSLGNLTALTWLSLSNNGLAVLPHWFGNLTALSGLNLSRNRLAVLPEWFGNLTALSGLNLSNNSLAMLPESLGNLTALSRLDLSNNRLAMLPESLGNLMVLSRLDLSNNGLAMLPQWLGNLATLTWLKLSSNELSLVPESLGNLVNLTTLDLANNALGHLPPQLGTLAALTTLSITGNRLASPPPEICASGTRAVLAFMRALLQESDAQWSSKMLVVGEAAVGKTSVSKALCGLAYDPAEPQTHGVHVDELRLSHPQAPDTTMALNVWDFGGQLEYRATQRFYLTDRSLFLLVWNSRRGWRNGGQVEAWLQAITNAAPTSPIVIVATHCRQSVADLDERDLRQRYPKIAAVLRVDCQDGSGIAELRERIGQEAAALPLMGKAWPRTWSAAAQLLANEPGWYTTTRRALELLRDAGMEDEAARTALMTALHDRGEILHFAHDPELREMIVLHPTWVDEMITRILDSQTVADRGGLLSRTHRAELWDDLDDLGLREALTVMMERFDLAYRIDAPDHEDVALVVERLPAGAPDCMPPDWEHALETPGASELRITYKLASRQAGVPSWFIAREHRFSTGAAWARGVLLRHRGAASDAWALLQDNDHAQPTLRLTVRGTAPHVFYSLLNEGFTGILAERYPGLEIRQLVPCSCKGIAGMPCTYEFDYITAQRAAGLGHRLQCQQSFAMVDPRELLFGLNPYRQDPALTRIESKLDLVAAGTSRIEHAQLLVLDTVRDLLRHRAEQGAYCPSIFTITKAPFLPHYQLSLYCEQPDGPHPLPDGAGVYTLTRLPGWLHRYAPYLGLVLAGIKHGLPLVGPALTGILGETVSAAAKAQLELSGKLLEHVAVPPSGESATELRPGHHTPQTRADFAELRKALIALDPDFGGLRERELPENRGIVYLCRHHREALRYPARSVSQAPQRQIPPTHNSS
ncbi:COR domain-containing protein [Streptacidiphilus sp. N1-3]|uniref:non-specific serine/threonine protein kinase n=1 Tax=Streptacidiphilus alkalitolerans TaxID=3342712 RepID=A0ABV6X0D5_9ACTN